MEENYQFLPPFKKQFIQVKTSIPQIHCLKWIYFFQPKKRNICGSGRRLSIFVSFQKMYPDKTYMPKNFSVWSWLHFLQPKEQKLCGRKLSIFATFQKTIYPGNNFHTTNSLFEMNILFSAKETKYMWKWKKTIYFCHLSKKCIPTKFTCQKVAVFEVDYTFFNQRNKKYVEKDYQFLPPFKKQIIQVKYSMPKSSVFEIDYTFFTFFNQRNEIYVEENYQFLKNVSQKKFHAKNLQLFKLITVFF